MRKFLILASFALAALYGCTKIETKYVDVEKEVAVDPISSYSFDGKKYSVHTLTCGQSEDYIAFVIAREPKDPFTSYIVLYVLKDHIGQTMNLADGTLLNRYDYMIIFEDANHYYPAYSAPRSGVILVAQTKAGYHVSIDILLADGKPLVFDYDGDFAVEE